MTRSPDQEDSMTDQRRTPTTDDIREGFGLDPSADFYEPAANQHLPGGPAFDRWLAAHDAEVRKPLADIAMEGALLIEWVRQVVGGLSDPTRAELDDLFDQCSDYSDKWNSGSTEPLPDPRMPSVGRLMDTLHAHRGGSIYATADGMQYTCACGLTGSEVILQHHVAQAVLAIMPKPTDTEETK